MPSIIYTYGTLWHEEHRTQERECQVGQHAKIDSNGDIGNSKKLFDSVGKYVAHAAPNKHVPTYKRNEPQRSVISSYSLCAPKIPQKPRLREISFHKSSQNVLTSSSSTILRRKITSARGYRTSAM